MKPTIWTSVLVISGLGLFALQGQQVGLNADSEAERVATVRHLMEGIQQPNMKQLTSGMRQTPADDKAWAELELAAALLNECSHLLTQGDRSRGEDWNKACLELRESSAQAAQAASDKDPGFFKSAAAKIAASCKSCHDLYQ
jgi:hypothetical protein